MVVSSPLLNPFLLPWFFAVKFRSSDLASTKDSGGLGERVHDESSNLPADEAGSSILDVKSSLSMPDVDFPVTAGALAPPDNSTFGIKCVNGLYTFKVPELAHKADALLPDGLADFDVNVEMFPLLELLPTDLEKLDCPKGELDRSMLLYVVHDSAPFKLADAENDGPI